MSASSDELTQSERRFLIHSCLGRGGFGEVYRAMMVSPGGVRSEVALKVLRADIDPGSEAVARLRDEGRLLGAIRHPSILHVHDLVVIEGRVALVTEYVEGQDLDRCIVADPPLSVRALVMALSDVASALHAAWSSPSPITGQPIELVHRDIKPANIRVGRHGEVKLLDFGVARAVDMQREAHTADHAMMGSYLYMAPERFTDEVVEPASDVFALGCVLYEGLARRRYFQGMNLKTIYGMMLSSRKLQSHLDARIAQLPPLHEDLERLLRDLLASHPEDRPSALQAAQRGEDLADDLTGSSLKRWARRRDWPQGPPTVAGSLEDGRELVASAYLQPVEAAEPAPRKPVRGLPPNVRLTPPPVKRRPPPIDVDPAPLEPGPPPLDDPDALAAIEHLADAPEVPPMWPGSDLQTVVPQNEPIPTLPDVADEVDDLAFEEVVAVPVEPVDEPIPLAQQETGPPPPTRDDVILLDPDTEEAEEPEPIRYVDVSEVSVTPEPLPEMGLDSFEGDLALMREHRRRSSLRWMLTVGFLALVAAAAALWALAGPEVFEEVEASLGGDPGDRASADPRPVVRSGAERSVGLVPRSPAPPAPVPQPSPEVAEAPAEAPTIEPPSPEPEPPRSKAAPAPHPREQVRALHQKGWKAVDQGDLDEALALFDQALRLDADHPDGLYGRGYTLMKLERDEEATEALCGAIAAGNAALQREVKSIMSGQGLRCR